VPQNNALLSIQVTNRSISSGVSATCSQPANGIFTSELPRAPKRSVGLACSLLPGMFASGK